MLKIKFYFVACLLTICWMPLKVWGDTIIQIGPTSIGSGGSNPISLPPTSPVDYQLIWLDKDHVEWRIAISPGIFRGYRFPFKNSYVAIGSGLAISSWGGSLGIYGAAGYDYCFYFCFNFEYMKALGIYPKVTHPYTVKVGIILGKY